MRGCAAGVAMLALMLGPGLGRAEDEASSPEVAPCPQARGWAGPLPDDTLWWFEVLRPGDFKGVAAIRLHFANGPICQEARRAVLYVLDSLKIPDAAVGPCR